MVLDAVMLSTSSELTHTYREQKESTHLDSVALRQVVVVPILEEPRPVAANERLGKAVQDVVGVNSS
jgi:hypothetical protein